MNRYALSRNAVYAFTPCGIATVTTQKPGAPIGNVSATTHPVGPTNML
jgi:hypothetical protein